MSAPTTAQIQEVLKSLGMGNITTDALQKTDGGALTSESLATTIIELGVAEGAWPLLDSIPSEQEGNEQFKWDVRTSNGHVPHETSVQYTLAGAVDRSSAFAQNVEYVKWYATGYGTVDAVTGQPNAFKEASAEDVPAMRRLKSDQSTDIFHGNATNNPLQPNGYEAYQQKYSPNNVFDLASQTALGLDAQGFSNPLQLEVYARNAGQFIARPQNGSGRLTRVLYAPSIGTDLDNSKNFFTGFVDLKAGSTTYTGSVIGGFNNRFGANNGQTAVMTDQWIMDGENLKPYVARSSTLVAATATNAPTSVTPANTVATAGEKTRFIAAFYGVVNYFVVGLSAGGMESTAVNANATISAAGNKVVLTIVPSAGGLETAYSVYRTHVGGTLVADARWIGTVPKAIAGNTTFTDLNYDLPGAVKGYGWDDTAPGFMRRVHTLETYNIELARTIAAAGLKPYVVAGTMGLTFPHVRRLSTFKGYVPRSNNYSPILGNL